MKNKTREMKNLLIYPRFQIQFISYMIMAVVGTLAVVYLAHVYFIESLISFGVKMGLPTTHPFFTLIHQQQTYLTQAFLIAGLISIVCWSVVSLLLSHRIAAPLIRLIRTMKALSHGDPAPDLKFRKGDYFVELAEAFNAYLKKGHKGHGK